MTPEMVLFNLMSGRSAKVDIPGREEQVEAIGRFVTTHFPAYGEWDDCGSIAGAFLEFCRRAGIRVKTIDTLADRCYSPPHATPAAGSLVWESTGKMV